MNYIKGMTDFLYARPSVIEGIGRNLDFFGSMNSYNYSANGEEADKIAIATDLLVIYEDFYKAYSNTLCQLEAKKTAD
ncbi:MAG: hypothetical protein LBI14_07135 [Treponema sp.]|jgi:hypothetical protein|nr:hypothetical protein [Treponema sp.]